MQYLSPALDGAAKQDIVQSNGLALAYEQFGRDHDPVLLLIMGLGTQLIAWPDAFCQALADSGLRVIRFDNRDIGLSGKIRTATRYDSPQAALLKSMLRRPIDAPYELEDMAADAVGLMDALGIERAHVAGASMGGMIAQLMAGMYAERVLSLTSIMSTSGARNLPRAKLKVLLRLGKRPAKNDEDTIVAHMTRTMRMISGPLGHSAEDWAAEIRKAVRRSYYPPGTARQMLAVMAAPSRVEMLRGIEQPALVTHGKADPLVPVKHGRDTARHLRNVRYEEIAGMGHDLPPKLLPQIVDMMTTLIQGADGVRSGPA